VRVWLSGGGGVGESRVWVGRGMESSGDGGDEGAGAPSAAGMGSPGPPSAPAAVGGGSSGAGASGSGGKPPVKRVMKTPYQLEVLERTYTGSSAAQESECFGFVFRAVDRNCARVFHGD